MKNRIKWSLAILLVVTVCATGTGLMWGAQDDPKADQVARRDFMRVKMMYSSNILQGLTNRDFKLIQEGADEIIGITGGAKWLVVQSEEYQRHSNEMKMSAEKIRDAAKARNLEGATLRFFEMTIKCIDCHEHIRELSF